MANLFGRSYTKQDLLRYAGNLSHIAGVEKVVCTEGKAGGTELFEVKTGSGLEFTLTPGRCLDITSLRYRGINLSHRAKNGLTAPGYCLPVPGEFNRYVSTGMMFTCGLLSVGPESREEDGAFYAVHGNIANTPADNIAARASWEGDDYIIEIAGDMRESAQFGHNLVLHRTVRTALGSEELEIRDVLENQAPEDCEYNILYHFNYGFPFLSEDLQLEFPENAVTPRTEQAKAGLGNAARMQKPEDGFFEHVFFRDVKADRDGLCCVTAKNRELGIGASIIYERRNLPVLAQWKSMRSGDYALGIEPTNSYIMGRSAERANGSIARIGGFKTVEFNLKIRVFSL